MTVKKRTRKPIPSTPLVIRDADGTWHNYAADVSQALNGTVDYTAGTQHALAFTAGYYKHLSKTIDYTTAPLDLLRDYAIHGYDFTIRAAALAEIERRITEAQA